MEMLRHDYSIRHPAVETYPYLQRMGLSFRVVQRLLPIKKYGKMKDSEVYVTLG